MRHLLEFYFSFFECLSTCLNLVFESGDILERFVGFNQIVITVVYVDPFTVVDIQELNITSKEMK
jgi:hypothetical protein